VWRSGKVSAYKIKVGGFGSTKAPLFFGDKL